MAHQYCRELPMRGRCITQHLQRLRGLRHRRVLDLDENVALPQATLCRRAGPINRGNFHDMAAIASSFSCQRETQRTWPAGPRDRLRLCHGLDGNRGPVTLTVSSDGEYGSRTVYQMPGGANITG